MLALHLYEFLFESSNFWLGPRLAFTVLRCVIPVVCRINQTLRCMRISSNTTILLFIMHSSDPYKATSPLDIELVIG